MTCAVVESPGIYVRPGIEEDLRYLRAAHVAGPEEGGPGVCVPLLQAGALLHQQPAAVRPHLPGGVVQGRAALAVLQRPDTVRGHYIVLYIFNLNFNLIHIHI